MRIRERVFLTKSPNERRHEIVQRAMVGVVLAYLAEACQTLLTTRPSDV